MIAPDPKKASPWNRKKRRLERQGKNAVKISASLATSDEELAGNIGAEIRACRISFDWPRYGLHWTTNLGPSCRSPKRRAFV